jgi:hypothetical protein
VTDGQRRYAEARARRLEARQSTEALTKANKEGPKATGEPRAQTATPSVEAARVPTVKDKPVTVPQAPTKLQVPATPPAPPRSSDGRLGLADLKRLAQERKQRALEQAAACSSV